MNEFKTEKEKNECIERLKLDILTTERKHFENMKLLFKSVDNAFHSEVKKKDYTTKEIAEIAFEQIKNLSVKR